MLRPTLQPAANDQSMGVTAISLPQRRFNCGAFLLQTLAGWGAGNHARVLPRPHSCVVLTPALSCLSHSSSSREHSHRRPNTHFRFCSQGIPPNGMGLWQGQRNQGANAVEPSHTAPFREETASLGLFLLLRRHLPTLTYAHLPQSPLPGLLLLSCIPKDVGLEEFCES